MKKITLKILLVFILITNLPLGALNLFAQENKELLSLSKQVMQAKTNQEARVPLENLKKMYLKGNDYNGFVELLNSILQKNKGIEPAIDFYIGFTRYGQLQYLEESQNWDEYFSQGNTYRSEIEASLAKVVASLDETDVFSIYAKLILWKFHHGQQDTLAESALEQLMAAALACAEKCPSPLAIKQVADELFSAGEKLKSRQLYKIYVEKIASSDIKNEELKRIARGFYRENNLELAEALYDVYIDRAIKAAAKAEAVSDLLEIATTFLPEEGKVGDIFYAEKIFKKIQNLAGKEIFDEELTYARAFYLEKAKEYAQAKDIYVDLSTRFPAAAHYEEAVFKTAMIYTYVLRDIEKGRTYFMSLARNEKATPAVIASLYQLGLLAQWQEDLVAAEGHYDSLLERAGRLFKDRVALAKARLKEITQTKPLEYNLKKFLDLSLQPENSIFTMSKIDLKSSAFKLDIKQSAEISATSSLPASGCMEIAVDYLWSGNLGAATPSLSDAVFQVDYSYPGTKEINLVAVSSSGVIDRSIIFLDVY